MGTYFGRDWLECRPDVPHKYLLGSCSPQKLILSNKVSNLLPFQERKPVAQNELGALILLACRSGFNPEVLDLTTQMKSKQTLKVYNLIPLERFKRHVWQACCNIIWAERLRWGRGATQSSRSNMFVCFSIAFGICSNCSFWPKSFAWSRVSFSTSISPLEGHKSFPFSSSVSECERLGSDDSSFIRWFAACLCQFVSDSDGLIPRRVRNGKSQHAVNAN